MPLLMPGNILNNILKGKLGVASVWDTDPANLENMTDGDLATVTGTGSKVMGAGGSYGHITFDLGSVKTVLVGGKVGIWSTAGNIYCVLEQSDNNITWNGDNGTALNYTTLVEQVSAFRTHLVTCRYFRLRFYVTAASTAYAKIYEVMAWELTL